VEQLPEVPIRLEDPGTLASLNSLLELENDALQQGREQKRCKHLRDLEEDVAGYHRRPLQTSVAATTSGWGDRPIKARLSVCQSGSTGVISPKGG
jgi:hypothetical protein